MNATVRAWLFFRALRWVLWLGTVAYYGEFMMNRGDHGTHERHAADCGNQRADADRKCNDNECERKRWNQPGPCGHGAL